VQLEFFAKSEVWLLHKVDGFSAETLDDLVGDGQRRQFLVDYREFVFGTENL
jgi:hypothetical protein